MTESKRYTIELIIYDDPDKAQALFEALIDWMNEPVYDPEMAKSDYAKKTYGPLGFFVPRAWEYGDPVISVTGIDP